MSKSVSQLPILYSFRRCPYAMRARIALYYGNINCEIREVDLKNKPTTLIKLSPKATVPVLTLPDGRIIEESMDIIYFAVYPNETAKSLHEQQQWQQIKKLIRDNDQEFVSYLRKYKYFENYPEANQLNYRCKIEENYLAKYEIMLRDKHFLFGKESIADIAIIPFIRQFALVKQDWFFTSKYSNIIRWLNSYLKQDYFQNIIMAKPKIWYLNQPKQYFLPLENNLKIN